MNVININKLETNREFLVVNESLRHYFSNLKKSKAYLITHIMDLQQFKL